MRNIIKKSFGQRTIRLPLLGQPLPVYWTFGAYSLPGTTPTGGAAMNKMGKDCAIINFKGIGMRDYSRRH